MDTPRAYRTGRNLTHLSDKSDDPMRRVRAALIARGTSLRVWAFAWAKRHGRNPLASYSTVRVTISRWGHRRDRAPEGELARMILDDLRAEIGPELIPPFPKTTPRRRQARHQSEDTYAN